ncbi:MAG: hypothetical protein J6W74_02820 [Bacteroidales bacterium]|nr:hypothetical protein [Bacteroidales bacterium]
MKSYKRFLLGVIILMLTANVSLFANFQLVRDGDEIEIVPIETSPEQTPRGPVYNPFFGSHFGNYVYLGSLDNIGTVTVELYSTAGDWMIVPFDTSTGSIILPISGLSGSYSLIITTSAGVTFEGQFVI